MFFQIYFGRLKIGSPLGMPYHQTRKDAINLGDTLMEIFVAADLEANKIIP